MKEFYLTKVYKSLCDKLDSGIREVGDVVKPRDFHVDHWKQTILLPAIKAMIDRTWNTEKWKNGAYGNPPFSNIYNDNNGIFLLVYPTHCSLLEYPIADEIVVQVFRQFKETGVKNNWCLYIMNVKRHDRRDDKYLIIETY